MRAPRALGGAALLLTLCLLGGAPRAYAQGDDARAPTTVVVVVDLPATDGGEPEALAALKALARQTLDRIASRITPDSGRSLILMAAAAGDPPVLRRAVSGAPDAAFAEITADVAAEGRTHIATVLERARKNAGPTGALVYVGSGAFELPSTPAGPDDVFGAAHRDALVRQQDLLREALAGDARVILPSAFVPQAWRAYCDGQPAHCLRGDSRIAEDGWLDPWLPVFQPPEPEPDAAPVAEPPDLGPSKAQRDPDPAGSQGAKSADDKVGDEGDGRGEPGDGDSGTLLIVLSTLAGIGVLITVILLLRARQPRKALGLSGLLLVEETCGPVDDPIRHEAILLQPGQREYRVDPIPCSTGEVVGFVLRATADGALKIDVLYDAGSGRSRPEPIDEPLHRGGAVHHADLRLRLMPVEHGR